MKTLIAQLNYVAKERAEGDTPLSRLENASEIFGLKFVAEDDDCRIYEAVDGTLINCWIVGVETDQITDGGLGFDDQVEWFINDLITQAQAVENGAPSVQAVNNAIRDGRLRGYKNLSAKYQRQGATLVSESASRKLWPV